MVDVNMSAKPSDISDDALIGTIHLSLHCDQHYRTTLYYLTGSWNDRYNYQRQPVPAPSPGKTYLKSPVHRNNWTFAAAVLVSS